MTKNDDKGQDHKPSSAQEWRDLLKARYDYPDEAKDGTLRQRRRARKAYRRRDRERRQEWIREERQKEPVTAGGALLLVALLLLVGLGVKWWSGSSSDTSASAEASARPSPSPSALQSAPPGMPMPSMAPAAPKPSSPSPPASLSENSSPDVRQAESVVDQWVRQYLTRNPPVDETHEGPVRRAAPWASAALTDNLLHHTDPAWDILVSRGGIATVTDVKITPAGGDLPPDNPLRVWRNAAAEIKVHGYTDYTETRTLRTEVMLSGEGKWQITRVLGL
ncbi:hypothetical protein GO001_34150 [Streptomyces sp. NRRL B-1677]|uniref:hypothetical protein n=1 Tax=Streptomyces sp. NRRL B-1677 TaxID=2682966 RepID=UPI001892CF93|nr:hypothetical protein [Streptomyces sp. NRRL B-1677]MBF6050158.1 hypothetical protein [Streptomyces sp. NRRL B-1677]